MLSVRHQAVTRPPTCPTQNLQRSPTAQTCIGRPQAQVDIVWNGSDMSGASSAAFPLSEATAHD
eukprot:15099456-Alexandrium_andersonii.AAC.1